ncbi:MAG: hypothetical protein Greene041619_1055 [Candidatus Peregrinibacteria bacterium Greene0416_19]|nr:MAG: hypothetical protein Greene041619_1055 [Candidatus Peregrinibacteria bacterium Greene0416_19]
MHMEPRCGPTEPDAEAVAFRNPALYPVYRKGTCEWNALFPRMAKRIMRQGRFLQWILFARDEDVRRELRKWGKPAQEWVGVDLEWEYGTPDVDEVIRQTG